MGKNPLRASEASKFNMCVFVCVYKYIYINNILVFQDCYGRIIILT